MWLVKFSKDWADEFTAEGLVILTDDQKLQLEQLIEEELFDFYFGTNEGWDAGEVSLADFTFTQITEEEKTTLERLIPDLKNGGTLGQTLDAEYIAEALINTTE